MNLLSTLTHLPFLIPLGGALLSWLLPQGAEFAPDGLRSWTRRWLYLATLLLTFIVLLATRARQDISYQLPFVRGLFPYGENLAWSYDGLAKAACLLLTGALALAGLGSMGVQQSRAQATLMLVMLAAVIGMCTAANLLTLVLLSVLLDIAVMSRSVIRVPEENLPHAIRQTLVNLAALVLLILACVLAMAEQGGNQPAWQLVEGLPRSLLMLSILLRLGMYPLPGSTKRRWEVYLFSISAGAYLWLRLVLANPSSLPYADWLTPICWGAIGITALMSALAPQFSLAVPWLILNQVAFMVLAPLIDPVAGSRVVMLGALNLLLCLTLLRIDADLLMAGGKWEARLRRWAPWPFVVALASLGGVPFTLGGQMRWAFMRLCWLRGWTHIMPPLAVVFALLSMPAWLRLRRAWLPVQQPAAAHWRLTVATAGAYAAAAALLLLGLFSDWLVGVALHLYARFPETELVASTSGLARWPHPGAHDVRGAAVGQREPAPAWSTRARPSGRLVHLAEHPAGMGLAVRRRGRDRCAHSALWRCGARRPGGLVLPGVDGAVGPGTRVLFDGKVKR